jgi:hypothetical protein
VSNLLGELSAVIRDGDAFGDFVQLEGCGSPLAKQTLQQATSRREPLRVREQRLGKHGGKRWRIAKPTYGFGWKLEDMLKKTS